MEDAQILPSVCGLTTSASPPSAASPSTPVSVSGTWSAFSIVDAGEGRGPSIPTRYRSRGPIALGLNSSSGPSHGPSRSRWTSSSSSSLGPTEARPA